MFAGRIILVAFLISFVAAFPMAALAKLGRIRTIRALMLVAAVASAYCIAAGIFLSADWQDPFATATTDELTRGAVSSGGRGGIIILVIRYWPLALIAFGSYFGLHQVQALRAFSKRKDHPSTVPGPN